MNFKSHQPFILFAVFLILLVAPSAHAGISTTISPSSTFNNSIDDAYTFKLEPSGTVDMYVLNITIPAGYEVVFPSPSTKIGEYRMFNKTSGKNKTIIIITANNTGAKTVDVNYSTNSGDTYTIKTNQSISGMNFGGASLSITEPDSSSAGYMNISLGGTAGPISTNNNVTLTLEKGFLRSPDEPDTNSYTWITNANPGGYTGTATVTMKRLITAAQPGIPANNTSASPIISSPIGDIQYVITAGAYGTPPVQINVTVQAEAPSDTSVDVGAGAIPNVYYEIEVDDPAWYDNITSLQVKLYYDESDIPSNVQESTLRVSRYLSNTTPAQWVKLDCGTCPRTLEIAADGKDVDLLAAGVNTADNYVWANLTHYSTFAMAGTVSSTPPSGGGGSGNGGNGVSTFEPFENIEKAERHEKNLIAGKPVTYTFTAPEHGISEIVITGEENEYDVAVRVEALKGTSKLVSTSAPGDVYKNVNVWAGTERIKETSIRFKIENSWLEDNNIAPSKVRMVRYNKKTWVQLETTEKNKDTKYTHFEAKSPGFSSFAITGLKDGEVVPTEAESEDEPMPTPVAKAEATAPEPGTTEEKQLPGFGVVAFISAMVLMVAIRNKRS